MSSYFDKASSEVAEARDAAAAEAVEVRVVRDVRMDCSDQNFPLDLREKIEKHIGELSMSTERGRQWFESIGSSKLIDRLHDDYHELAGRRIGMSDNPISNARLDSRHRNRAYPPPRGSME